MLIFHSYVNVCQRVLYTSGCFRCHKFLGMMKRPVDFGACGYIWIYFDICWIPDEPMLLGHPQTGRTGAEVLWICWCTWSAHKFETQDGPAHWGWESVLWKYRSISVDLLPSCLAMNLAMDFQFHWSTVSGIAGQNVGQTAGQWLWVSILTLTLSLSSSNIVKFWGCTWGIGWSVANLLTPWTVEVDESIHS